MNWGEEKTDESRLKQINRSIYTKWWTVRKMEKNKAGWGAFGGRAVGGRIAISYTQSGKASLRRWHLKG